MSPKAILRRYGWLLLLPVAWGVLYLRTRGVANPAILPDEAAYFIYIGQFARQRQLDTSQYGPLYILCASLFYDTQDILKAYMNIRLMNVFAFGLAFVPLYLLAEMLIGSALSSALLAFGLVFMPWSSLVPSIWAEPLFFMLSCWCWYFSYRAFRSNGIREFRIAGLLVGLAFLAKQGGGIILACAFLGAQLLSLLSKEDRRRGLRCLLNGAVPIGALVAAYLIVARYMTVAIRGYGYSNVVRAILSKAWKLPFQPLFWVTFFHQIGYIIAASYFVFPAAAIVAVFRYRELEPDRRRFLAMLGIQALGLCLLIAYFTHTVDIAYGIEVYPRLAFGRYLSPLIPGVVLIGAASVSWLGSPGKRVLTAMAFLALFVCLTAFSPLYTGLVTGIASAPDTMYLSRLIGFEFPPWHASDMVPVTLRYRAWIALGLAAAGLVWSYLYSKKALLGNLLFCCVGFWAGAVNAGYFLALSRHTLKETLLFRYLASEQVTPKQLLQLEGYQISFHVAEFWLGLFDYSVWDSRSKVTRAVLENYRSSGAPSERRFVLSGEDLSSILENVRIPGFDGRTPLYRLPGR